MIKNVILNFTTTKDFVYKVKEGENLDSIAKKFNIPVNILKGVNDILDVEAYDRIIIPKVSPIRYFVKPFESLLDIAKKFNVSVEYIKAKNYIEDIHVMQELVL